MKTLFISLLLVVNTWALTPEKILEISKLPHSRANLLNELTIFPEASEFHVNYQVNFPPEAPKLPQVVVREKTVQGRYIVSEFTVGPVDKPMELILIATYSDEIKSYKKWLFNKMNNELQEFTGVRLQDSSFISWIRVDDNLEDGMSVVMGEEHGVDFVKWTENYYQKNKLVFSLSGHAEKVK